MPGTYRIPITLSGIGYSGPYVNVWHVALGAGADPAAELNGKAAIIRTFYSDLVASVVNVGQTLAGGLTVSADFATDVDTGIQVPLTWSPLSTGSAGQNAPYRLALVVSWKSTIAARRATGRTFVGPLNAGVMGTDGLPKPQTTDAVRTAAQKVLTADSASGNATIGTYGLVTTGGGPKDPHTLYAHSRVTVKQRYATLRRRG